jgi:hypothetical protein
MGKIIRDAHGREQIMDITTSRSVAEVARNVLSDFKGILVDKLKHEPYTLDGVMYLQGCDKEISLSLWCAKFSGGSECYLDIATGEGNSTEEAYDDLLKTLNEIN